MNNPDENRGDRRWGRVSDDVVRSPLWEFPPQERLAILRERRRRGFYSLLEEEPIGDPEFS